MRGKIFIVNHTNGLGGAEVGLSEWIRFLDRDRVDPVVVLPAGGEFKQRLRDQGEQTLTAPLARLHRTRNPFRFFLQVLRVSGAGMALTRLIRDHHGSLLHANSDTAHLVAALAARRAGIPCIWHARDLVPLGYPGRWMYRHANVIVAVSATVARHVNQYRSGHDRVRVIPNGIDTRTFVQPVDRRAVRHEFFKGIDDHTVFVGMVANLAPWKRHDLFLDMAERLADTASCRFRFIMAGDDRFNDHPEYQQRLRQRSGGSMLAGRVCAAGYREDMPELMQALDILVHPAGREPFGRVMVEAMAAAKPVVAVNSGGAAEIVVDGVTGRLVPPGDPDAMAAAVSQLANDAGQRRQLGENGRRRAVDLYDVRRVGAALTDLYVELLQCHPAG